MTDIDIIDRCIIALLQVDGRLSLTEIGRRLNIPEPTVRRRVKRLVADDVMQIVAVPNPRRIGYGIHAVIGAKIQPGFVNDVVDRLIPMRQVRYVGVTAGTYDVVIEALFHDNEEFRQFLTETLGTVEGLRETETSYVLDIAKRSYRIGLAADIEHDGMSSEDSSLLSRCRQELQDMESRAHEAPVSGKDV